MKEDEELRLRRDRALNAWRREVQRLAELAKSTTPASAEIENQKRAVGEARDLYDSLNDEYLNYIHEFKVRNMPTAVPRVVN